MGHTNRLYDQDLVSYLAHFDNAVVRCGQIKHVTKYDQSHQEQ